MLWSVNQLKRYLFCLFILSIDLFYKASRGVMGLMAFYSIGQPGMARSISPISRMVSFKATTTFW